MNHLLTLIIAMAASLFSCQQKGGFQSMSVSEFDALLRKGNIQLVDVRTPEEYADGHLANSTNIDVKNAAFLENAEGKLSKDIPVAVYCRSGQRSKMAAGILIKNGYTVYDLNDGIMGWQQAGKEIVK